jgi:hypothetical protein
MLAPRSTRHVISAVALLLSTTGGLAAALSAQSSRPAAARPVAAPAVPTRDTTLVPIVLYQEDVLAFIDQPTVHLIAAEDAMARHDRALAARELAAAAANVRVEAGYTAGAEKTDLLEVARDMDHLSAEVRSGRIHSADQLDGATGRAERALARHHWERAARAWEHRDAQRTGMELRAAANATERASRAAGRDAATGTKDVVRGARVVSGKLIDGAGWTVDEVGKGIADLGHAVERLGRDVEPRRR